jgi:hypothetical protein
MKYRNIYLFLVLLFPLFFSCKQNKKQLLIGTWHVTKWENPNNDTFYSRAQRYIDTIGKGHTAAENIQIYGVANVDSLRGMLQKQYDSSKAIETGLALNAVFKFRKDGIAEVTLAGTVNTGKWMMDDENGLIMEQTGFGNAAGVAKFDIIDLTDKEMKLLVYQIDDSSTVTFTKVAE